MSLEPRIQELGAKILDAARAEEAAFQKKHRLESSLLAWCMDNEELRNRTFRFIDVFPSLKTARQVLEHIREYFPLEEHRLPQALRAGLYFARPALLTQYAFRAVTDRVYRSMAALFIGAPDEREVPARVREWDARGVRLSVDLLGEKTTGTAEADLFEARYARLIETLGGIGLGADKQNVSVKLSALDPRFSALDAEGTSSRVRERLGRLLELAGRHQVHLHIDMEDYETRDLTLSIVRGLLQDERFRGGVRAGIVLQAYLRDAEETCDKVLSWARTLAEPLTIRLVRGAYWDSEVMKSQELGWPVPVFTSKNDTDWMYERLTAKILGEAPKVRLAVATHNIRSIASAVASAQALGLGPENLEFQVLYGMGAPLLPSIRESGFHPRIYMPVGDPVTGMAYLVRRLLENVSSQSFVRRSFHDPEGSERLLAAPQVPAALPPATEKDAMNGPEDYRPAPLLELHREEVRRRFEKALEKARMELGFHVPMVMDGLRQSSRDTAETLCPGDGRTTVAQVSMATAEEARETVLRARRHFETWRMVPVAERAACLMRARDWMLARRYELAALEVLEVGKPWKEADADVAEAIDYLAFYALNAGAMVQPRKTASLYQETNEMRWIPRGVAAVIAPWNFPMAILTGMSAAALVTGNTAVLKPAEQSSFCAWKVYQALVEGGVPPGVVQFLPGLGEVVGPELVQHPETAVIAFTGSRDVGLWIQKAAHAGAPKQVKKIIVEMGGKNALIVDSTADFDQAIPAVLASAFGYAGQKCSALSRLIVLSDVYDLFLKRLAEAAEIFAVDYPWNSFSACGPVIAADAQARILDTIREGKVSGRVVFEAVLPESLKGFYVPPVILADLPEDSRLLTEEIFGPVLCVLRARDFRSALELASRSQYALTGGVFSRTPSHLELARQHFAAGNLYLNRGITGAVVGRQPFGGFRLSGGGTKAGSAEYLREFCIPQTVTENIARHGFAPI